jgi:hypothetical protein
MMKGFLLVVTALAIFVTSSPVFAARSGGSRGAHVRMSRQAHPRSVSHHHWRSRHGGAVMLRSRGHPVGFRSHAHGTHFGHRNLKGGR